jgi:PadR family transcriptional regulator PadR
MCFFSIVKEITMAELLGEFEQLVLIALVRLGTDAYGVSICDDIADRSGRAVSVGAVYKTLDRLENRGLVTSRIGEPTAERGGRRKKHFRVLAAGQRALKESMAALRRMTDGIESEIGL